MEEWDTGIIIDDYVLDVKLKRKENGVYFAQVVDSFFLVAASGKNLNETMHKLYIVFVRIRAVILETLLDAYGIIISPSEDKN